MSAADTTAADILAAEKRGYGKGYRAGVARKQRELALEARERQRSAFWQRAMLAALPFAMQQDGWRFGEAPIRSIADRVRLAANTADAALREAINRGHVK